MDNYVILHGHFYQPPRENPWTGNISHQDSAAPFKDWNRRITAECYGACVSSRVLDGAGRISSIINNFRTLSWNFGPTLLSWLEKETPNVYAGILEADAESCRRLGYGNAVAQGFNHTILPLDRPVDARTQVIWGMEDFRHRFGREADGMWLPETGVNEAVLDILIEQGLSYVILSPWQAAAVRRSDGTWEELEGRPGPTNRPFFISRPGGRIAAFFYDPDLASGISFGHLLRSREGFEEALNNALKRSGGPLVSIATDGEIYGHHEPFGDMCLAALIDRQDDESNLVFTNYAAYLAANPPTEEVRLGYGEDGRGSSWSCAHGVGRWRADCGCSTGGDEGWNQKWRKPLRQACDGLRDAAEPLWTSTVAELTGENPRDVLNRYGRVLSGGTTPSDFALHVLKGEEEPEKRTRLLEALEGAKYLQFIYTSCGWFFSELSGIEPVQNIRYAYRVTELLDPKGDAGLLTSLSAALKKSRSNISEKGSGSDILNRDAIPSVPPVARIAAAIFWRDLYSIDENAGRLNDIDAVEVGRRTAGTDTQGLLLEGEVVFTRRSTLREYRIPYRTHVDGRLFCPRISVGSEGGWTDVPISAVHHDLRSAIQDTLLRRSEKYLRKALGNQALVRLRDIKMVKELGLPLSESRRQSVELTLHYGPRLAIRQLRKRPSAEWPPILSALDEILVHRKDLGMHEGLEDLESRAGALVSRLSEDVLDGGDAGVIEHLVVFLEIMYRHGMRPLKPYAQNAVYRLLEEHLRAESNENEPIREEDLRALADLMNINPERFLRV